MALQTHARRAASTRFEEDDERLENCVRRSGVRKTRVQGGSKCERSVLLFAGMRETISPIRFSYSAGAAGCARPSARPNRQMVEEIMRDSRARDPLYDRWAAPRFVPRLLRAQLLQIFYSVRRERCDEQSIPTFC